MNEADGRKRVAPLPGWLWKPTDRKTAWLCGALIAIGIFFPIGILEADRANRPAYMFGDFFALWSYARIVLTHPAAELYDFAQLHAAQVALGMPPQSQNPFPYPPTFLLMIWPFGYLPYYAAYAAWAGTAVLLYLAATCAGTGTGSGNGIVMPVAALLAPTTSACLVAGQSGFFLAALLVGGLRLVPYRPLLAGVLFGLLTYKPQFGLMVPVALAAAGQWRCIAAAGVTAMALAGAAIAVFGASIWAIWWQALAVYAAWFDHLMVARDVMPTVLTNMQILGFSQPIAWTVQIAASVIAALATWWAWSRLPHQLAVPATLAATCLATPHAFLYDLPMLSSAVLLFASHRLRSAGVLIWPEIAIMIATLSIPVVTALRDIRAPISTVAIGLFLGLVLVAGRTAVRSVPLTGSEIKTE